MFIAGCVIAALLTAACNGKQPVKSLGLEVTQVRVSTDTTPAMPTQPEEQPTDEELRQQQPVSQTVDEVFDDFIVDFDIKPSFQRQRVVFPLIVSNESGNNDTIQASEWQHRYIFMRQDFCTVLWNSKSEMEQMTGRLVEDEATVELFYLHSRSMTSLHFKRDDSGRWLLNSIINSSFMNHELASFLDFYRQFATDSTFQQEHLASQLHYATTDDDTDEGFIEGTIGSEQWTEFAPEMPQDAITNIRYGQTYNHPHRIVMQMQGFDDGFQALFIFRKESGKWRLTGFEN